MTDDDFFEIFQSMYPRLYRFAYGILHDVRDAEEVVADGGLAAHRHLVTEGNPVLRSAEGLIFYAVRNKSLNRIRDRNRGWGHEVPTAKPEPPPGGAADPDPEGRLARCVDELDETHRTTVTLRHVEEFSTEEIADIMGCSAGTIRRRHATAMRLLRECLDTGEAR